MRFLIQRVTSASVRVNQRITGKIEQGLLVFIGIAATDTTLQADTLIDKTIHLRVFVDSSGKMNRSVSDIKAGLLLVSQFTLYGDTKRGRRPSFGGAASPEQARPIYDYIVDKARTYGLAVETGIFQEHMEVELVNDGPVTLLLES